MRRHRALQQRRFTRAVVAPDELRIGSTPTVDRAVLGRTSMSRAIVVGIQPSATLAEADARRFGPAYGDVRGVMPVEDDGGI